MNIKIQDLMIENIFNNELSLMKSFNINMDKDLIIKNERLIWDYNIKRKLELWEKSNYITIDFRLSKIDIKDEIYNVISNPYRFTKNTYTNLINNFSNDEIFLKLVACIYLIELIYQNRYSLKNSFTFSLSNSNIDEIKYINFLFYLCDKHFNYENNENLYKKYFSELYTDIFKLINEGRLLFKK